MRASVIRLVSFTERFLGAAAALRASCIAIGAAGLLWGCGGASEQVTTGDAGLSDAEAGALPDVWTQCRAPDGVAVCGTTTCSDDAVECGCLVSDAGGVAPCLRSPGYTAYACNPCSAEQVCVDPYVWDHLAKYATCEPLSMGVLFGRNGGSDRAWFSDFSAWSDAPIGNDEPCPSVSGLSLCGGTCAACPEGQLCTGRSPVHPFGWCSTAKVPSSALDFCSFGKNTCSGSNACLTYVVQPEVQAVADANGFCLPPTLCDALVSQLPGGARCTH